MSLCYVVISGEYLISVHIGAHKYLAPPLFTHTHTHTHTHVFLEVNTFWLILVYVVWQGHQSLKKNCLINCLDNTSQMTAEAASYNIRSVCKWLTSKQRLKLNWLLRVFFQISTHVSHSKFPEDDLCFLGIKRLTFFSEFWGLSHMNTSTHKQRHTHSNSASHRLWRQSASHPVHCSYCLLVA